MASLPLVLQEIREVAGLPAALEIARRFGGSRVSIPAYPKEGHWLVETVGENAAQKICAYYRITSGSNREIGVKDLSIPLGPTGQRADRNSQIKALLEDGVSADEIARRLGIHRQTVLRQSKRIRDPRQADLFEF
ncbi:helix-turn-helix domain-containing protein [Pseudovibrio ascidiaceicola]|uniref:helix-turn-helix domain-containing protein n=1 Tax=Pseudovibrio ascidiaceicola TaxID=285279 RepID=UPI003D368FA1